MKNPAYKKGEKISWSPGGNGEGQPETAIIHSCHAWRGSFTYLLQDRQPHVWVMEEWIEGWEDRRRLRDKLDGARPGK